jgi:hypothetical protein
MSQAGIEPAIPASELPQTQVLDGAATGIGTIDSYFYIKQQYKPTSYSTDKSGLFSGQIQ